VPSANCRPPTAYCRLILFAAAGAGAIAFTYFFVHGWTTYHYDAKAHLVVGRRITDSLSPGYSQVGNQWLPLLHLLYLLPSISWKAYQTGLAAGAFGFLFYVASCYFVFRLSEKLTGDSTAALLGAAVYLFNPNLLFLQAGAFTEPLYLLLMTANAYYFLHYEIEGDVSDLRRACLWGGAAALCRYEGCILLGAEVVVLLFDRARSWSGRLRQAAWLSLGFSGLAVHLVLMRMVFGETYLAKVSQGHPEPYITHHQVGWSLVYHVAEVIPITGVILFIAAMIGLIHYLTHAGVRKMWAPILLLTPSVLCVAALYWGLIYRVRYGIELLPAAAVFSVHLLARSRLRKGSLAALWIVTILLPYFSDYYPRQWEYRFFYPGPGYLALPLIGFLTLALLLLAGHARWWLPLYCVLALYHSMFLGEWHPVRVEAREHDYIEVERGKLLAHLRANFRSGRILVDMASTAPFVFDSKLPIRNFIYNEGRPYWWDRAVAEPEQLLTWVVARKGDEVDLMMRADTPLHRSMALVIAGREYSLYELRATGRPQPAREIQAILPP